MKSLLVLVGLLAVTSTASAFNAQQFFRNYCYAYSNNGVNSVQCANFYLSEADKQAFQNETFIISNATNVFLTSASFEFNENFVNKFPNATNIDIEFSTLNFGYAHSNISKVNKVLKTLTIGYSSIYGAGNITAFGMLTGLTELRIRGYYIESYAIDNNMFANNTNLETLELSNLGFTKIDANAFGNLQNLKTINITGTGLSILPNGLLQSNRNLQTVVLSNNNIEYLPPAFFPRSVVNIQLKKNILQVIGSQTFKELRGLSYLDLSENTISVLSDTAFNYTENLSYLDLHNNLIPKFERKQFSQNQNLKTIYLYNNKFTSLPQDIFDDLPQLEIVAVNPQTRYLF